MTSPDDGYEPLRRSPVGPQPQAEPVGSTTNGVPPTPEPVFGEPEPDHGRQYQSWPPPTQVPGGGALARAPLPIPIRTSQQGVRGTTVRIGLWGGARSGKTTVISALPIAAMQAASASRSWIISGFDEVATKILTDGVNRLVNERRFPPGHTQIEPIMWTFQGIDGGAAHSGSSSRWSRLLQGRSSTTVDFALELQDVPGEFFRNGQVDPRVVENLALSDGLLYVFDPVLESHEDLRSFHFFYSVLQQVTTRVRNEGRMERGRLPHHVAVLVTKFDDPSFFEAAVREGWVSQEQTGARMPYIPEGHGEAFFDWVCRVRQGESAELVRDALRNFFHADRVEYFACSAVGFKLNPQGVFDYGDYANVEMQNGGPRLRSLPRPINVLEPLVRLERRIRGARGTRAPRG